MTGVIFILDLIIGIGVVLSLLYIYDKTNGDILDIDDDD